MCGFTCGIATTVVGGALVVVTSILGFAVMPGVIENSIAGEVSLHEDTIQMERFQKLPFPLDFKIHMFNISNPEAVLNGGIPQVREIGPYVYKLYRERLVEEIDGDIIKYRIQDHYEFSAEDSFPYTEDDMLTIVNTPYIAVLQSAELSAGGAMSILNSALSSIFGDNNSPIKQFRFRDLAFDGIKICENPNFIGRLACVTIKDSAAYSPNFQAMDDGSLLFSLFGYRLQPTQLFESRRGLEDPRLLGEITNWNGAPFLRFWLDQYGVNGDTVLPNRCNMVNGTDSGIYAPFIDREEKLYAFNPDICRSVELRYQYDLDFEGINVVRFSSNEWFLDNHEDCFCLNVTAGVTAPNGCLLPGAMELLSCSGGPLVLSYPHFLYAHPTYRTGVLGMTPNEDAHRIFMDLEPITGTVVRGSKRAQFNAFLRPISGIPATENLPNVLTPMFWIEEGVVMPEDFLEMVRGSMSTLRLLDILIPVVVGACAVVLLLGVVFTVRAKRQPTVMTDKVNGK